MGVFFWTDVTKNKIVKQTKKVLNDGFTHILVMVEGEGTEVAAILGCCKEAIDMPILKLFPDAFNKIFYMLTPVSRFEYTPLKNRGLKTLLATDKLVSMAISSTI